MPKAQPSPGRDHRLHLRSLKNQLSICTNILEDGILEHLEKAILYSLGLFSLTVFSPQPDLRTFSLSNGKEERETSTSKRNIDRLPPAHAHAEAGDKTGNPGVCPDGDLNPQPFGTGWDSAPTK